MVREFTPTRAADFPYVWYWKEKLGDRKGQPCRVVCRGMKGSILVEFMDGHRVATGRYAVSRP